MEKEREHAAHAAHSKAVEKNGMRAAQGDARASRAFEPITREILEELRAPATFATNEVAYGMCVYGLLIAWFSVSMFFPGAFSPEPSSAGFGFQCVSVVSLVVVLALCMATPRMRGKLKPSCIIVTVIAVVLIELIGLLDLLGLQGPSMTALLCVGSVAGGAGMGLCFALWSLRFAVTSGHTSLQVGGGLVLSCVVVGLLELVPQPAVSFLWPAVPAALLASLVLRRFEPAQRPRDAHDLPPVQPGEDVRPGKDISGKLKAVLIAVGLGYGLAAGYALSFEGQELAVSVASLLSGAAVGVGIFLYASVTGNNFGYTAASTALLPLMIFGEAVIGTFGEAGLAVGIFFQRAAFMVLCCILWMQLPKIVGWGKNIRGFFYINVLLFVSMFVGLLMRCFLLAEADLAFRFVTIGIIGVTAIVLTYAFGGEGAVTAWDLMPLPETRRGKGYRVACEEIKGEFGLTNREFEVMYLAARGRSGVYIQDKLCIAAGTFQTHMRNIYKKIDVHSNQELIDLVEAHLKKRA